MGLKKGQCNNPNGRPKGTPNILTRELRQMIIDVLDSEVKSLPVLLKKLEPQHRIQFIIKLVELILPKPAPEPIADAENESTEGPFRSLIRDIMDKGTKKVVNVDVKGKNQPSNNTNQRLINLSNQSSIDSQH